MEKAEEIAKMIDHSLLHPTLTDNELIHGCELAKQFNVASVCIKPYSVKAATETLKGSDVAVGTVIGFPHGGNKIDVKVFETEQALKDGAVEIDMVVNIGKVLSEDWEYIKKEIQSILTATRRHHAILKVIFENDFLSDKHKIQLCKICSKMGVEYVKTSTGYGFVKGDDGRYSYQGATDHDLQLMRANVSSNVQVKAAGKIRTLEDVLRVKRLGATRIGATTTESIIIEARKRMIS